MKKEGKEIRISNWLIGLMGGGVAFTMWTLFLSKSALSHQIGEQLTDNYFLPPLVGCTLTMTAVIILMIGEERRRAGKKR